MSEHNEAKARLDSFISELQKPFAPDGRPAVLRVPKLAREVVEAFLALYPEFDDLRESLEQHTELRGSLAFDHEQWLRVIRGYPV